MPVNQQRLRGGRACLMLPTARRNHGEAQPGIRLGLFTVRIPLVHYEIEAAEILQGIIMTATSLGGVALLESLFGIPYPVAITIIVFQHIGYFLHQLLGDITISGWLTPAVPLIMSFVGAYELGPARIEAYIALQLTVGLLFILLGWFRAAEKLIRIIPRSLKSGLILGAGIGALTGEYGITPAGIMLTRYPISFFIGVPLLIFLLYSEKLKGYYSRKPDSVLSRITQFGIVPGLIVVSFAAALFGEASVPQIEMGFLRLRGREMIENWSVVGLGFPDLKLFISAIPAAFVCFILAFGEVVLAEEMVRDVREKRPDEQVDFSSGRLICVTGIRNLLHGLFAPTGGLSGPNWAAMTMAVSRRYENGPAAMYSLMGGAATFNLVRIFSILFLPIVSLLTPFREPILCLLMILQGFACLSLGNSIAKGRLERTEAILTGIVLAYFGAAVALGAGILMVLLLEKGRGGNPVEAEEQY
jgi:hypothetical protein